MEPIIVLVVALIGVVLAWKLFKGLIKTAVLVGILVVGAVLLFGGFN